MLKNAPILLCDEPTSSLDTQTEIDIMSHLKQLGGGRTTLLIAHRLSTVQVLCREAVVVLLLCYFVICMRFFCVYNNTRPVNSVLGCGYYCCY